MKTSHFGLALRGSFKRQIILTFVFGFILLMAAFVVYLVQAERTYLYRDNSDETASLAESLAASSAPWVLANDVAGLQEVVQSFQSHPELRYAMVISPSGRVLAHSDATKVGQFVADERSLALIKATPVKRVITDEAPMIDIAVPIMVNHRFVAWARIAQGREGIAGNLRQMMLSSAFFVLLSTILSLLAAVFIANRLGYRIGALVKVAKEVRSGNFATRVQVSGADEFSILGNSLNQMLDALARDDEQLRSASLYTRSLIEASLDPLVTISLEGKITDVNHATEEVTGRNRTELVGTDFSDYFTEPERAREGYRQVFQEGSVTDYPLAIRHREGDITEVLYNASVYRDEDGEVLGVFAAARDITERKQAEATRTQLAAIVEFSNDAIIGKTSDGIIVSWNKSAERIYGYSAEEIIGKSVTTLAPPSRHAEIEEFLGKIRNGETVVNYESERIRKDGVLIQVALTLSPIKDASGNITGISTIARDITARKRAEDELRSSKERLALAIKAANAGTFEWDIRKNVNNWSPEMEALYGVAPGEFGSTSEAWETLVYPEDLPVARAATERALQTGELSGDWRIRRKDGEVRWLAARGKVLFNESGQPERMFGIHVDITERKQIEISLNDSDSRLRDSILNSPNPIMIHAEDGEVIMLSKTWTSITGYDLKDIPTTKIWTDKAYGVQAEAIEDYIEDLYGLQDVRKEGEYAVRTASGETRLWDFQSQPLRKLPDGRRVVLSQATDITERKRAEDALREKEERLALATLKNGVGIWDWNLQTQEMIWDDSMFALYHIHREDFSGTEEAWRASLHPDDLERGDKEVADAIAGIKPFETEFRVVWPNGEIHHIKAVAKVFRDDRGTPLRMLGINMDITERKQAEEGLHRLNIELEQRVVERTAQLEAANKELEAFSYSVSHDLRAPLRAIDGFSRILLEDYAGKLDDEGQRLLDVVRDNTTRMEKLINDILQFSRTGRLEMTSAEIDMESLAHSVFEELRPAADASRLQVEIGRLPPARGDHAMLRQVFVNLLSNAIKFSRSREAARIEVGGSMEGEEAVYFVRDNGVGFDMRYVDKLFGVFQRLHTVNEFEGTGIGLAIVKRVIDRHGGRVWAEGKLDEGTTIYFALPIKE